MSEQHFELQTCISCPHCHKGIVAKCSTRDGFLTVVRKNNNNSQVPTQQNVPQQPARYRGNNRGSHSTRRQYRANYQRGKRRRNNASTEMNYYVQRPYNYHPAYTPPNNYFNHTNYSAPWSPATNYHRESYNDSRGQNSTVPTMNYYREAHNDPRDSVSAAVSSVSARNPGSRVQDSVAAAVTPAPASLTSGNVLEEDEDNLSTISE